MDTLAQLLASNVKAGIAAAQQQALKYTSIVSAYTFADFRMETLGPWGPGAQRLYRDIDKR